MENWEIKISDEIGRITKAVFIFRRNGPKLEVMQSGDIIKEYKLGEAIEPTIRLFPEQLVAFVDAALRNGTKPSEMSYTEGKLSATEKHLEDMRTLVFKPVEIIGKQIEN